jgi:hypothetical protein
MILYSVELDTVTDEFEDFKGMLANENITYTVVNESGPAGGWPIIRYTSSSLKALKFMIKEYWGDEDLYDAIEEE